MAIIIGIYETTAKTNHLKIKLLQCFGAVWISRKLIGIVYVKRLSGAKEGLMGYHSCLCLERLIWLILTTLAR